MYINGNIHMVIIPVVIISLVVFIAVHIVIMSDCVSLYFETLFYTL